MRLLITGGAGYIGSHIALKAIEEGYDVTIFDDLSTGSKNNIHNDSNFVYGSTTSESDLKKLFNSSKFDGVIHLAASKAAGESMINPGKYASNNIVGSLNLIKSCVSNNINVFIFSSTAAVYGMPSYQPIDERHFLKPTNYYGFTKLAIEQNLNWFSLLHGLKYASLRYFNAAGYDDSFRITELESSPQNLIPKVMEVALGLTGKVEIYGNDYKTKDGTGVRDFIHVMDLATAHLEAIKYLLIKRKT